MSTLGIIGGTGLAQVDALEVTREETVATPFGAPSAPLLHGQLGGRPCVFLARHGAGSPLAPHAINYRANLWALRGAGVGRVIAVNAVGGIGDAFAPGTVLVPVQLIDYSWGRAHSYCDGLDQPLRHVDFTVPYSPGLRAALIEAAARAGIEAHDGGTYAVTQGPRLETAAEIDRLSRDGCDVVGMTGMPEAALARELELEYACCAAVVNWAAGRGEDIHAELDYWVERVRATMQRWLMAFAESGL